eukprot:1712904-Rhodomonas_salina.1
MRVALIITRPGLWVALIMLVLCATQTLRNSSFPLGLTLSPPVLPSSHRLPHSHAPPASLRKRRKRDRVRGGERASRRKRGREREKDSERERAGEP